MNAQAIWGNIHVFGWGIAIDKRLALVYTEKGTHQGHLSANTAQLFSTSKLGMLYYQGQWIPQNLERGADLLKRAASMSDAYAQYLLASCYDNGMGVAKDYMEARQLFTLASALGIAKATEVSSPIA